jgi:ribosomal protein S18 acetylase RimI-like enzyme
MATISSAMEIVEESLTLIDEYARVPIAFEVRSVLDVSARDGAPGFELVERPVDAPFVKDYDAIAGNRPSDWARRFDVSRWGMLCARAEGRRLGGVVIAFDTAGVTMLDGRRDLAVIWDLRVVPDARRGGVGSRLFAAAETWARARGCRRLEVETQNNNLAACRLYARQGCTLGAVRRDAYPDLPEEIQLLWHKAIA